MKKNVLGVKIDDVNMSQALDIVKGWLVKGGKHYIVTPNPEIIVMANKDEEVKKILNKADLAIPDGVGLKLTTDIVCNTTGIDVMETLILESQNWGSTIGLLGGGQGVAKEAAECLRKKYPKIRIVYADSGGEIDKDGNVIARSETTKQSNQRLPRPLGARNDGIDILFVGFGPPKQEKWIAKNLNKIPVKVAMGVGGSFDYLSGRVPRAPKFIRAIGFEWLFRLAVQPWRIKRQLALLEYLWLLILRRSSGSTLNKTEGLTKRNRSV